MSQQPRRFPGPEFWTAFFTGVLAASTVVALIVAYQQLKEFHAESQIQHLLALEQQFDQEPMLTYRRGLAEKRLKNQDEPDELYAVLDFFETVGLLVKRGYLNESDVWNTFAIDVFTLNSDERQVIDQQRRKDPTIYAEFNFLVERLSQIEEENHGMGAHPSKEEIKEYYQQELSAGKVAPRKRK